MVQQVRSVKGFVSGRVQGVGFRYFVTRHAQAAGLCGYVRNLSDGRVEFLLQGDPARVGRVIEHIRQGPNYARVADLATGDIDDAPVESGFVVR